MSKDDYPIDGDCSGLEVVVDGVVKMGLWLGFRVIGTKRPYISMLLCKTFIPFIF